MTVMLALKLGFSLAVPVVLGYLLLARIVPIRGFWTRASLAVGLGFGASSYLFFLWLLLVGKATSSFMFAQCGVAFLLGAAHYLFKGRPTPTPFIEAKVAEKPLEKTLRRIFFLVLFLSVTAATLHFLYNPQGDWDAWDLWNMRALFLSKAGLRWRDFFVPEMPRAMDYPLMLSAAVAAAWKFLGTPNVWVPGLIALLFTYATVGLLVGSCRGIRGASQAWLAGILLASTPFFAQHGASQYADVELGFYLLGAVALWTWQDYDIAPDHSKVIASGVLAGLAVWTKNEGQLIFLALFLARILTRARPGNFSALAKELGLWLVAALPGLLLFLYFKGAIAPPNDLFSRQSNAELWAKIVDPSRHLLVWKAWVDTLPSFGRWRFGMAAVLLLYGIALGLSPATRRLRNFPLLCLVLIALGYHFTYVTTPYGLQWHMDVSLNRLLIHLWPAGVFAYFLSLRAPEEAEQETENGEGRAAPIGA